MICFRLIVERLDIVAELLMQKFPMFHKLTAILKELSDIEKNLAMVLYGKVIFIDSLNRFNQISHVVYAIEVFDFMSKPDAYLRSNKNGAVYV